ncbi:ribosome biogenesis factor YjgA [Thiolapillus sp.]
MREVDEDGLVIRPNKTRLKRELADLQKLVTGIIGLGENDRAKLELDARFLEGVRRAAAMKPSSGRNREIKYLTKQLQKQNLDQIRSWFENRDSRHSEENRRFHALEKWRDRLVEQGDQALQQYLEQYPHVDRQQIRALIRNAVKERNTGKPAGAGKKLFRQLRENSAEAAESAILSERQEQ